MSKAPFDLGHKSGYLKVTDLEFLEVGERREVTHGASSELFGAKWVIMIQADLKSFDQRKQPKVV